MSNREWEDSQEAAAMLEQMERDAESDSAQTSEAVCRRCTLTIFRFGSDPVWSTMTGETKCDNTIEPHHPDGNDAQQHAGEK